MLNFTKTSGPSSQGLSARTRRQRPRASLGLESLEERQLMSTLMFVHGNDHHGKWDRSHIPTIHAPIQNAVNIVLNGTATGTFSAQTSNGTTSYSLSGSGVISPLQSVTVAATITHSITQVFDTGTVVLDTPPNSPEAGTLSLTSVAVKGSLTDPAGEQFHYTARGTGAFAGITGSGTFKLVLNERTYGQGQFTLVFNPLTVGRV
jgi:hypothetical protein